MTADEIREMRAKIERYGRGYMPLKGNAIPHIPFGAAHVRQIIDYGRYNGLSNEDIMTWLVFELLQAGQPLLDSVLDHAHSTMRHMVIHHEPPANQSDALPAEGRH